MSLEKKLSKIAKNAVEKQQKARDSRGLLSKGLDAVTNKSYANEDKKAAAAAMREWENKVWKPKMQAHIKNELKRVAPAIKPGTPKYERVYNAYFNKNHSELQQTKAKAQQSVGTLRKPKQSQRQMDNEYRQNESIRNNTVGLQAAAHTARDTGEAVSGALATGASRTLRYPLQLAADIGKNDDGGIFDRGAKALERHEDNLQKVYPAHTEIQQNGTFGQKLAVSAVEQVPTLAASFGTAGAAAKGVQLLGAGAKTAAAVSYGTAAATMYPQSYGDGNDSTKQEIEGAQAGQLARSPRSKELFENHFNDNIKSGLDEDKAWEKAREQTISSIAEESGHTVGLATLALSMLAPGVGSFTANRATGGAVTKWGQKVFNTLAVKADAGKVAKVAVPAAVGTGIVGLNVAEEALQEGYTDYKAQQAAVDVGVKNNINMDQLREAALMGGILGGAMGGGVYIGTRNSKLHQAQDDLKTAQQAYAEVAGQIPQLQQQIEEVSPRSPQGQALTAQLEVTRSVLDAMAAEAEKASIPRTSLARRAPRIEPTNSFDNDFDGQVEGATELSEQDFENALNPDGTPAVQATPAAPVLSEKELDAQDVQLAELIAEQAALDEAIEDGSNEKPLEESIAAAQSWYDSKRGEGKQGLAGVVSRAAATEQDAAFAQQQESIKGATASINDYIASERAKQQQIEVQLQQEAQAATTDAEKQAVAQKIEQREIDRAKEDELLSSREQLAQPYENESFDTTVIAADGAPFNLARFWDSNMPATAKAKAIAEAFGGQVEQNVAKADWQSMPEGVQKELHQWFTERLDGVRQSREGGEQTAEQEVAPAVEQPQELAPTGNGLTMPVQQPVAEQAPIEPVEAAPVAEVDSTPAATQLTDENPVINIPAPGSKVSDKSTTVYKTKPEANAAFRKQGLDVHKTDIIETKDGYIIKDKPLRETYKPSNERKSVIDTSNIADTIHDGMTLDELSKAKIEAYKLNEDRKQQNTQDSERHKLIFQANEELLAAIKAGDKALAGRLMSEIDSIEKDLTYNVTEDRFIEIDTNSITGMEAFEEKLVKLKAKIAEDMLMQSPEGDSAAGIYKSKPAAKAAIKKQKLDPKTTDIVQTDEGWEIVEKPADSTAPNNDVAIGKDGNAKWFGSNDKAQAFIDKKGISDTHEVVSAGKSRFEIQPKAQTTGATNQTSTPTDVISDKGSPDTQELTATSEQSAPAKRAAAKKAATEKSQNDVSTTEAKSRFADNKLFTEDKVAAARALLKSKMGQLNSGFDPEMAIAGMTLAGEAEALKQDSNPNNFTDADRVPNSDSNSPTLDDMPKYSKTNPAKGNTGTTAKQVVSTLQKRFGKEVVAALIKSGKLRVRTLNDFVNADGRLLIPSDAEGFYYDGKVTLIADNLTPETVVATLLHEMGGHAGIQSMLAPQTYMSLMENFYALVRSGNKYAVRAKERAEAMTGSDSEARDEYIPYLITEYAQTTERGGPLAVIKRFVNRVMAGVRTWVRNHTGVQLKMTPNDMVQLAERMVKRLAEQSMDSVTIAGVENMPAGQAQFSQLEAPQSQVDAVRKQYEGTDEWMKSPNGEDTNLNEQQWLQVRTPAFKEWFGDWEGDPDNASKVVDDNGEPLLITKTTSLESVNNSSSTDTESSANTVIGESGLSHIDSLVYVPLNTSSSSRSGDTELIKPSSNSGLPTLEYGGYFVRAIPIPPEVDKVGASNVIPSLMDRGVLRQGNDLKIGGFVVKPIVVNVMDVLGSQQTSSDGFFNNDPVLKNLLSIDRNNFISIPKGASTHSNVVAVAPTKEAFIPSEFASMDREWRTASSAGNLVHIDLPNGYYVVSIARNKDNGATQIKSATDNAGTFDSSNPDIRFSRRYSSLGTDGKPVTAKEKARDRVALAQATTMSSKFGVNLLLRRHLATPQHVALLNPVFKIFTDNVQARIAYENNEAGLVQTLLPEIWDTRLVVGKKKEAMERVSKAIFDGTMADKVWSDSELQTMFDLTDKDIGFYRRARAAIDTSVMNMTVDTLSSLAKGTKLVNIETIHKLKLQGMHPIMHNLALQQHMTDELEKLAKGGLITPKAEARLQKQLDDVFDVMAAIAMKYDKLVADGYAPLMRFGDYVVVVRDKVTNDVDLFELHETKGRQSKAIKELKERYDTSKFHVGGTVLNPDRFKQFTNKGLSPETVQLFAAELGLDDDNAIQAYLKVAVSDRSALKRFIHRNKVPGYSEDMPRVLSAFVMSNARHSGRGLYNSEIERSIQNINDGNLQNEAQKVFENIENPQEEFAQQRSLMFHYFMGFSPAFFFLNLTQPFTQTIPKLTAYVGAGKGHAYMAQALAIVGKHAAKATINMGKKAAGLPTPNWTGFEDNLPAWVKKEDYLRMAREGHLDPQNIYMIKGLERGKGGVASGVWGNIEAAAGWFAEVSESINRRSTMIAAFRVAKDMGDAKLKAKGFDSKYDFAVSIIQQTQGIYNKGNRSGLARGNGKLGQYGPLILVFKQFTINYTEQMIRHGKDKEAKSLAVAMMWQFALSGMLGLPFADDLRDLFEGIAYRVFGKAFNLPDYLEGLLGKSNADTLMYGIASEKGPIDIYGRSSLGNVIPGTDVIRPGPTDWAEILGASSGFYESFFSAASMAADGHYKDALITASPRYIRDAASGAEIALTGTYRNTKGDKIMDLDKTDAVIKSLAFNPANNARPGRDRSNAYDMKNMLKAKTDYFSKHLAEAIYQENDERVDELYNEMDAWNERNAEHFNVDIDKIEESAEKRVERKDFGSSERQNIQDSLALRQEELAGT